MVDTNIPHDTEDRLRNIEAHLGIGQVDEETGEYSVKQHEDKPGAEEVEPEDHEDHEL